MSDTNCNENWHIFNKDADIFTEGTTCKCGKMQTTKEAGKLIPVQDQNEEG